MSTETSGSRMLTSTDQNKLRLEDRAIHDWYRFVQSFPPHLVRNYLELFHVGSSDTVLDPFCGTGTTLVECKKLGIASVGIESHPMAALASRVKVDWSVDPQELLEYANEVAASTASAIGNDSVGDAIGGPWFGTGGNESVTLRQLGSEQTKLLLKNSISPIPLHKTLVLLQEAERCDAPNLFRYGQVALAKALVHRIGNLKFGPEVGVGRIRDDAPVVNAWLEEVRTIAKDIANSREHSHIPARVQKADARVADEILAPESIDAVITSPPYPNEKDYTRTTRLESVVLGLIRDRKQLRSLKKDMIRSNTRGVYKTDTDDRVIENHQAIQEIASAIERKRIAMGKTSGFERQYHRVTQLYFGGMARHLESMRPVLRPGAKLAYVVGDQASYLRVMIRTGQIIADLAQSLGYRVLDIDLFRTRPSTVTGEQLREEVVVMEWKGA